MGRWLAALRRPGAHRRYADTWPTANARTHLRDFRFRRAPDQNRFLEVAVVDAVRVANPRARAVAVQAISCFQRRVIFTAYKKADGTRRNLIWPSSQSLDYG